MMRKTLVGAIAFALISSSTATFALAQSANSSRKVVTVDDNPMRPMMERGTDLRPCKPGNHSEFSRLTGGYRCVRNP